MFIIVPILNPDGVTFGNSKTSLSGDDLRFVWDNPDRFIHPEIFYSKKLLETLQTNNDVVFFCEFGGHPVKSDNYLVGNHVVGKPRSTKEFVALLSAQCYFLNFDLCSFKYAQKYSQTAQAVIFREYGVHCSYSYHIS